MYFIIGVDIGGTFIKAGLVNSRGRLIKKIKIPTEADKGRIKVVSNIIKAIDDVYQKEVVGIGIGCPGSIDLKKGIIIQSPNLPINKLPLLKIIKRCYKTNVSLNNDAKCFVFAEALFGAGKKYKKVLGITLGTGVGGGVVYNHKLLQERMTAIELGHTVINYDGPKCTCGNYGCLEEYVSRRGIMRRSKGLHASTPLGVFELAKKGNKKALRVLRETGYFLGVGISNFINIFDPDIVIIGGDIAKSYPLFFKNMNNLIRERAMFKNVKVVQSTLKDSGILGAASLFINE